MCCICEDAALLCVSLLNDGPTASRSASIQAFSRRYCECCAAISTHDCQLVATLTALCPLSEANSNLFVSTWIYFTFP